MRGERVKVGQSRTMARVRGIRSERKGGLDREGRQIPGSDSYFVVYDAIIWHVRSVPPLVLM